MVFNLEEDVHWSPVFLGLLVDLRSIAVQTEEDAALLAIVVLVTEFMVSETKITLERQILYLISCQYWYVKEVVFFDFNHIVVSKTFLY